ncbi:MAG: SIR2 family NAD-dependent protein deacylase [Planctomycetota bacterium]
MITDVQEAAERVFDRLQKAKNTVVLTGAGVSTDSGIPDFRGPSGLYSKISQRTFEIDFLMESPLEYYKIAAEHIHPLVDREPNITHQLLSTLEAQDLLAAVITQNIDGLHIKAGSQNVVEFHGDVTRFHCNECEKEFDRAFVESQVQADKIPSCDACGALVRPGIVFFGDPIPMDSLHNAQFLAETADFFIAMGSSLEVNPAASMATAAKQSGAELCIINRGPTHLDAFADIRIEADLTRFSQAVLDYLGA